MYTVPCKSRHRFCYDDIKRHIKNELSRKLIPSCPLCPEVHYPFSAKDIHQLFGSGPEVDQLSTIIDVNRLARSPNVFPCPTPDCAQYLTIISRGRPRQCIRCPSCAQNFCSGCRQRHHYNISCDLVPAATTQWLDWTANGARDAAAARRRLEELRRDEEWKAAHCRLCPHCLRAVERIEGCNHMVCGSDAVGGNLQAGCAAPRAAGGVVCRDP